MDIYYKGNLLTQSGLGSQQRLPAHWESVNPWSWMSQQLQSLTEGLEESCKIMALQSTLEGLRSWVVMWERAAQQQQEQQWEKHTGHHLEARLAALIFPVLLFLFFYIHYFLCVFLLVEVKGSTQFPGIWLRLSPLWVSPFTQWAISLGFFWPFCIWANFRKVPPMAGVSFPQLVLPGNALPHCYGCN